MSSRLFSAVTEGNLDKLRRLVEMGTGDVNKRDRSGCNILHTAADWSNVEIVQYLCQSFPGLVNEQDVHGRIPLHMAVASATKSEAGLLIVMELLNAQSNPNTQRDNGRTPLHVAAGGTSVKRSPDCARETVRALLRYNASKFVKDKNGQLPWELAVDDVKDLCELKVPDLLTARGDVALLATGSVLSHEDAHLFECAANGDAARCILWANDTSNTSTANINSTDCVGMTALHHAAANGHLEVVRALTRDCGLTKVDATDTYVGLTALHVAAYMGHKAVCEALVYEAGCSVVAADKRNRTPRYYAGIASHSHIVHALQRMEKKLGISRSSRKPVPQTSDQEILNDRLRQACKAGDIDEAGALVKSQGANPNQVDGLGATAFHAAAAMGHSAMCKFLVKKLKFVAIDAQDWKGKTALHMAARNGRKDTVQVLLKDLRVNPSLRDADGLSPDATAEKHGHSEIAELIYSMRDTNARDALAHSPVPSSSSESRSFSIVSGAMATEEEAPPPNINTEYSIPHNRAGWGRQYKDRLLKSFTDLQDARESSIPTLGSCPLSMCALLDLIREFLNAGKTNGWLGDEAMRLKDALERALSAQSEYTELQMKIRDMVKGGVSDGEAEGQLADVVSARNAARDKYMMLCEGYIAAVQKVHSSLESSSGKIESWLSRILVALNTEDSAVIGRGPESMGVASGNIQDVLLDCLSNVDTWLADGGVEGRAEMETLTKQLHDAYIWVSKDPEASDADIDVSAGKFLDAIREESAALRPLLSNCAVHFPKLSVQTAAKAMLDYLTEKKEVVSHEVSQYNALTEDLKTHEAFVDDEKNGRVPGQDLMETLVELKDKRKTLKKSERKVRLEMEEAEDEMASSESEGEGDLHSLKQERRNIMRNIHRTQRNIDSVTSQLIGLVDRYYPELPVLTPNIPGVDKFCRVMTRQMSGDGALFKKDRSKDMYLIERSIAHGVELAEYDGKKCVLKCFALTDKAKLRAFRKEATLLSRIDHASVVRIDAVFIDEKTNNGYLQIPYYEGGNLHDWISHEKPGLHQIQLVWREIFRGVEAVHACGIVHCDIKPENILVDSVGIPCLADFDVSKDAVGRADAAAGMSTITVGTSLGTLAYMSPEVRSGRGKPTYSSDMYSLGLVVLGTAMQHRTPLDFARAMEMITHDESGYPNLPALPGVWSDQTILASHLCDLVGSMLHQDATKRPSAHQCLSHPFFTTAVAAVNTEAEARARQLSEDYQRAMDAQAQQEASFQEREEQIRDAEKLLQRNFEKIRVEEAQVRAMRTRLQHSYDNESRLAGNERANLENRQRELEEYTSNIRAEMDDIARERVRLEKDRRDMARKGATSAKAPLYWVTQSMDGPPREVDVTAELGDTVQKWFERTLDRTYLGQGRDQRESGVYNFLRVQKVTRIENPLMWMRYSTQRHIIRSQVNQKVAAKPIANKFNKLKFVVGNTHSLVRNHMARKNNHRWTVFLKPGDAVTASAIVSVEFVLHESFKPPYVKMASPGPYEVTRLGWGVFEVNIIVQLRTPAVDSQGNLTKELRFDHELCFEGTGVKQTFVVSSDPKDTAPVKSEQRQVTTMMDMDSVEASGIVLDPELNEKLLYTGVPAEVVAPIRSMGFDERVANLNGLFGAGVYFAEAVSKADQYVTADQDGNFHLFLARVCLGDPLVTQESLVNERRAPFNPSTGRLYDSVVGEIPTKYRELVVFDRSQIYPELHVIYTRTQE